MAKIIKHCEYCGKPFEVYPSQSSRRFHNLECYQKYKTELEIDIMVEQVEEFKSREIVSAVPVSRATAERISQNLKDIPGLTYHLVATIDLITPQTVQNRSGCTIYSKDVQTH